MFFKVKLYLISVIICTSISHVASAQVAPTLSISNDIVVEKTSVPVCFSAIGSLFADQQIEVTSRIVGYIQSIHVQEGQPVTKGQLLAIIDDANVQGAILDVEAKVNQAKNALKDALLDKKKFEKLLASGSATENNYQKIKLVYELALDNLASAKAGLDVAKSQRSYTHIVSPIDGNITELFQQEGDMANPGMPITRIETVKKLELRTHIPERHIALVHQNDRVIFYVDALGEAIEGVVSRIVPSSIQNSHRYQVHITPVGSINGLPGMFGRVKFRLGEEDSIVIPTQVLREQGGLTGVDVRNQNNEVVFRWLRTGTRRGKGVDVIAGLSVGDRIVVSSTLIKDAFSALSMELSNNKNEMLCQ